MSASPEVSARPRPSEGGGTKIASLPHAPYAYTVSGNYRIAGHDYWVCFERTVEANQARQALELGVLGLHFEPGQLVLELEVKAELAIPRDPDSGELAEVAMLRTNQEQTEDKG